ncbi:DUF1307 domain-containing protein [Gemella sanguinis]|uniref:DUF1307 domain-containing protein n=1 Tax=Gemella sanguinis TaxID=84135 RepID=A0ABX6FK50_9BACL|nr:DUF1307 domain-containing protein [Gemella sanguinis]EGF89092.1 hypothetical protein HMPREF0433_00211 [Gemella sanguinis M325]QGS07911.1 DUF1307 domain-containing protein [Gemella sanguinis]
MKNILKLITPLLAILVLFTACSKEKTKEFIKNSDDHEVKATLYYEGDTVNKFVTVDTFINNKNNISVEFLQGVLKKSIGNISGYSYNVEEKNGKITITYVIDYNKLDFEKAKSVHAIPENSIEEARKLSTITKRITENGFKEK